MKWADLSNEAKSILEWVEHVWTGNPQELTVERGKTWTQLLKYVGDVRVDVTNELFEEIRTFLPYSKDTLYEDLGDVLKIKLREGVKLH